MSAPDPRSEPLLPSFHHDRFEVLLDPHLRNPVPLVSPFMAAGFALLAGVLLWMGVSLPLALAPLLLFPVQLASMLWVYARRRVTVDARALTIERVVAGRCVSRRVVPLSDLRATLVVDVSMLVDPRLRGLRVVTRSGVEVFVPCAAVPVASLEWLAEEIRTVVARASEQAEGAVAPELVELLSDESRRRVEAARRARAAQAARAG